MTKKKLVDLASLDTKKKAEEGAELNLLSPGDGVETDIFIRLAGSDSDLFQETQSKLINKRASRYNPSKPFAPITNEERINDTINILARCTLGWKNMVLNGKELECSLENAKMVYQRFPWIREQADAFILERKNFLAS